MTKQRSYALPVLEPVGNQSVGELSGWKKAGAVLMFCAATGIALSATTFATRHSFNGADGANSYTALMQATDGNLYGTTIDGGANGGGNVFKITPGGKLTPLYDFCSQSNCADGQYPVSVLVQGVDGNFYGTTQSGGTVGDGTIFKITPKGKLTTLHSFNSSDGAAPYGTMVLATDGNFYGTANLGGPKDLGTVFRITANGKFTSLYSFCSKTGCADGQYPVGGLIQASDGNLYGTTHAGGNSSCHDGCGTVFKITPKGKLTTLHAFDGTDGEYPYGGVVEADKGMFFGTAGSGGDYSWGTVFKMTASGTLSTLHSFNAKDGAIPYAITLGSDGNFYGTTSAGGRKTNDGTVFKITPTGSFTTLHKFNGQDGKYLFAGLLQGTNGKFYGTTYFGGADDDGTVFSLGVGLAPFVEMRPTSGKVGAPVILMGSDLTGASSVSFNGAPARFEVVSKFEIRTTVPDGVGTGTVKVMTARGTLLSKGRFRVTK